MNAALTMWSRPPARPTRNWFHRRLGRAGTRELKGEKMAMPCGHEVTEVDVQGICVHCEEISKYSKDLEDLKRVVLLVEAALAGVRVVSSDQNALGWRDVLGAAASKIRRNHTMLGFNNKVLEQIEQKAFETADDRESGAAEDHADAERERRMERD